jgi:transposase
MRFDLANLPRDTNTLHRIIAAQAAEIASEREAGAAREAELSAAKAGLIAKALEIEKLELQIARLRRAQFGRSSEKIERTLEQLELRLEELETEIAAPAAAAEASAPEQSSSPTKSKRSGRKPLPEHLPRREVVHEPSCTCPSCGGEMRKVGEDVSEVLDYIPGRFEVIRHIRPAFSCRSCESMLQAPMPSLPIERGKPSAGLLAHVLVSKYCDHLPLYRQSGIYAREGVELDAQRLPIGSAKWLGWWRR